MSRIVERIVNAERLEDIIAVFGSFDENIKRIEDAMNVRIINRSTDLKVSGDEEMVDKAVRTLEGLLSLASKGEVIDEQRVRYLITLVNEGNDQQVEQMTKDVVCLDRTEYRHHRRRPRRHRKDLSGRGCRGGGLPGADGEPHYPDPSGGGGRRAAGLPSRRFAE